MVQEGKIKSVTVKGLFQSLVFMCGGLIVFWVALATYSGWHKETSDIVSPQTLKVETLQTPLIVAPSKRAMEASVGLYLIIGDEGRKDFLRRFDNENDQPATAIRQAALVLDADGEKLSKVELLLTQGSRQKSVESGSSNADVYTNSFDEAVEKSLKYNTFENRWEYAGDDESLQYNIFENHWEYASDDETTQYNALEDKWEYAGDDESLQYNTFENTWEYAPDDSTTKYNALEDKWEITSEDSQIKYNPFSNTWSYE